MRDRNRIQKTIEFSTQLPSPTELRAALEEAIRTVGTLKGMLALSEEIDRAAQERAPAAPKKKPTKKKRVKREKKPDSPKPPDPWVIQGATLDDRQGLFHKIIEDAIYKRVLKSRPQWHPPRDVRDRVAVAIQDRIFETFRLPDGAEPPSDVRETLQRVQETVVVDVVRLIQKELNRETAEGQQTGKYIDRLFGPLVLQPPTA